MHKALLKMKAGGPKTPPGPKGTVYLSCSGRRYWKWRGSFYAAVPQLKWFGHYSGGFDTVEINCSFYSWPTVAGVQASRRQPRQQDFVYTVKVCELITHIEKFKRTKTLTRDFGIIADILGQPNGMLAFAAAAELPLHQPRLNSIVSQLDSARRNALEFRHKSWWNEGSTAPSGKPGSSFAPAAAPPS